MRLNGWSQTLTWDALGRLRTMTGTTGADYLYDGDGQLAGTTVDGSTIANRLVPGPWPDEIAMAYQGSDLSLPYWSAQDRMGSVVSITDPSGGVIGVNTYDCDCSAGTATAAFWKPVRDRQDSAADNYVCKNWEGVTSFNTARYGGGVRIFV